MKLKMQSNNSSWQSIDRVNYFTFFLTDKNKKVRFGTFLDFKTEIKLLQKIWSDIPSVYLTSS